MSIDSLSKATHILLDAEDLQYISSVGLRVLLILFKSTPKAQKKLVEASEEIFKVLDMTGLSAFMTVEKKLQVLNKGM